VCSIMMFPKQPVELHKILCPVLTFKYGTEQEVFHDMKVAPWKSQICILTSDRMDLPYCRENLYSSHYLRSGVNGIFVGWHRNRLLLNEDRSFDLCNLFRTSAKHLCFTEGAVHSQVSYLYIFFCNQSDLPLFMFILLNVFLHQLSYICIPSSRFKLVQVHCDILNCRPGTIPVHCLRCIS